MAVFLLSPVRFGRLNLFIFETRRIRRSWQTLTLGAFLFVLLDIIIDPVALQGSRWFLGQIYGYRSPGLYFGIPMSNFGGWLLVGLFLVGVLQFLSTRDRLEPKGPSVLSRIRGIQGLGPILYASILAFNLTVTFWIGETLLGLVGSHDPVLSRAAGLLLHPYKQSRLDLKSIREHLADFPHSPAALSPLISRQVAALDHPAQLRRWSVQEGA